MDALFSFPPLVLALTVAALLGPSLNDAAIAIAIVFVPSFVRLLRGEVIAVREENYIEAARSLGATSSRLIRRTSCRTWPPRSSSRSPWPSASPSSSRPG